MGASSRKPSHDAHHRFKNWAPYQLYHGPRVDMDEVEVDDDWKTALAELQGKDGNVIVPGTREYWRARTQSDLLSRLSRGFWSQPNRETRWTVAPDDPSVHQQIPPPGLTQNERHQPLDHDLPRRASEAIDPYSGLTTILESTRERRQPLDFPGLAGPQRHSMRRRESFALDKDSQIEQGPSKSPKGLITEQLQLRQRDLMLAQQTPLPPIPSVPPIARPAPPDSSQSSGEWTSTSSAAHTSDFFDTDEEPSQPGTAPLAASTARRGNQALSPGSSQAVESEDDEEPSQPGTAPLAAGNARRGNQALSPGSSQAVESEDDEDLYGCTPPEMRTSPPPASLPSGTAFQPDDDDIISPGPQSTSDSGAAQSPGASRSPGDDDLYDTTPPEMRGRTGFRPPTSTSPHNSSSSSSHTVIKSPETDESEPADDASRRRSSQIGPLDTSRNENTRPRRSEPTRIFGLPESELEELARGTRGASNATGEAEMMESALGKFARGAFQGPQPGPSGLTEAQRRQDSQAQDEADRDDETEKEVKKAEDDGEGENEDLAF